MSEETPGTPTPEQPGQQQMQLVLDDRDLRTVYVNGYMFQPSGEEVVLDIGFNLPRQNPQGARALRMHWRKIADDRRIKLHGARCRIIDDPHAAITLAG